MADNVFVDTNLGKVSSSPSGAYDPNRNYLRNEEVLYDHDSWISKHANNINNTPADGSIHWFRSTNGGKHAWEEGESAKAKGIFAEQQANRAKDFSDHPPKIVGGWWYCWKESSNSYVKTIEADIDISNFTEDQLTRLMERSIRPHVSGSTLIFPATTGVSVVGSTLILTR